MNSRANRPGLAGRITSETGKRGLVTVDANAVSLDEDAILGVEPSDDKVGYKFLLAKTRPLPRTEESQGITHLHEMGIEFEDQGRTTIVGMAGCVLSYSELRILATQRNYVKPQPGVKTRFTPLYGISTITIGVPVERYKNIAERLFKQFRIKPDIDQEVVQNGYVWIDASINMPKVPDDHPDSDAFTNKYDTQVSYSDGKTLYAVGPVYSCCRDFKHSFKAVFFGNMRLKKTVTEPNVPAPFKLGLTLQTAQLYDLSDVSAPSNTEKLSTGLYARNLPASDALLSLLEGPLEDNAQGGFEEHYVEEETVIHMAHDDGTVYAEEEEHEIEGHERPETKYE